MVKLNENIGISSKWVFAFSPNHLSYLVFGWKLSPLQYFSSTDYPWHNFNIYLYMINYYIDLMIIGLTKSLVALAFLIWCPIIDTSCCLSLQNVCFLAMIVITKGTVAWIFLPAEFTSLGMLHLTSPTSRTRPKQPHHLPKCLHLHGLGLLLYILFPLL